MTKIAKLVCVSLMTRVIVDKTTTDEQILELAKERFVEKIYSEIGEHLEYIEKDTESPYDPDFDGVEEKCLNCGFEFIRTKLNTHKDELGEHCNCPKCQASSNINQ